jgi:hypothetical protein
VFSESDPNIIKPAGPYSLWPKSRHIEALKRRGQPVPMSRAKTVRATPAQMAKGLARNAVQAVQHGRVSQEIRDERYATCKACDSFIEESKRCSECGCYMEAKTWIGGNKDFLCPLKKWTQ